MRRGIASLVASLYAIGQVAAATNSSNAADNSTLIQAYLESGYRESIYLPTYPGYLGTYLGIFKKNTKKP